MQREKVPNQVKSVEDTGASYVSYTAGFVLSVVWTLLAYVIITMHIFTSTMSIVAVTALAILQLVTQLVFFLHLGRGKDSRWNIMALLFMLMILVIIVGGSIWIMYNLNYNMSPRDINTYMKEQNKAGF